MLPENRIPNSNYLTGCMTIKMNWTKARKCRAPSGTQWRRYHRCYCISSTIIKVRRSKLAIQSGWHGVPGASLPIFTGGSTVFKKNKCTHFFFHSGQMGSMTAVSKKVSLPVTLTGQLSSLGLSFPICQVGGGG